jgi:hypothetical protein
MAILLTRAAFAHSKQAATSNTLPKNTQNDEKQMKRTGRDKLLGKRQGILKTFFCQRATPTKSEIALKILPAFPMSFPSFSSYFRKIDV